MLNIFSFSFFQLTIFTTCKKNMFTLRIAEEQAENKSGGRLKFSENVYTFALINV